MGHFFCSNFGPRQLADNPLCSLRMVAASFLLTNRQSSAATSSRNHLRSFPHFSSPQASGVSGVRPRDVLYRGHLSSRLVPSRLTRPASSSGHPNRSDESDALIALRRVRKTYLADVSVEKCPAMRSRFTFNTVRTAGSGQCGPEDISIRPLNPPRATNSYVPNGVTVHLRWLPWRGSYMDLTDLTSSSYEPSGSPRACGRRGGLGQCPGAATYVVAGTTAGEGRANRR